MLTKYRLATVDDIGRDAFFSDFNEDVLTDDILEREKVMRPLLDLGTSSKTTARAFFDICFSWKYAYVRIEEENKSLDGDANYYVSKKEFDEAIATVCDLCDVKDKRFEDFITGFHQRLKNMEAEIAKQRERITLLETSNVAQALKKKKGRGRPKKQK